MPYKNKESDREWHRNYMRKKRNVTPSDEMLHPIQVLDVTPDDKEKRLAKAREVLAGVGSPIKNAVRCDSSPLKEEGRPIVPVYNPKTSQPGELVRKWVNGRWVEVIAKEVDAEGNEVPEYY